MTLIVEVPRCSYAGDGTTDTFATTFTFEIAEELTVWRGAPTATDCCAQPTYDNLLHPGIDYVILPGDWLEEGATIQVLPTATIQDGELITLMRTTPPDQPEGFGSEEEFDPHQHEFTLDRITRMIQELYNNPLGVFLVGGLNYDWKFYTPDAWTDTTPLDVFNIVLGLDWAKDFAGSIATVETYDAAEKVITFVDETAATVGTLTIPATSGDLVFATVSTTGFSKIAGKQLRAVPPAGGLGAVTGLAWTIHAEVSAGT